MRTEKNLKFILLYRIRTANMEKKQRKKRISRKQKIEIVLELLRGASIEEVSRNHEVSLNDLHEWRDLFLAHGESGFTKKSAHFGRESELERIIGRQQMEIELLKKKMRPYGKRQGSL